ncbi:hypothetical protein CY34DRAFT_813940 [Suillus luteus UH-Slu-Lm8-n1]|uniref:Uncharacterized protein n=1 Tax=Suillus luteus UH-Slu-Lm8-n1 TaxID=930992 RepID=A0A0C9ZUE0_9AGAM|nr:hypothetical protein CY34DRAFT_813940 [Suillus luteus UH-Slu-Lm8-n1]
MGIRQSNGQGRKVQHVEDALTAGGLRLNFELVTLQEGNVETLETNVLAPRYRACSIPL